MSRESEERHMGAIVSLYKFTIDQPDTGTRADSGHSQCTVGLPFQRTGIFRPENVAHA